MTSPAKNSNIFRNFIFYDFNMFFPCYIFIDTTPSNLTAFPLLILMLFCMSWLVAGTGENHTLTLYEIKHTLFFLHLVKAYWLKGITKPCTQLHPAPPSSTQLISTSTQLISAFTQLSATPSTIFEPKYCT